MTHIPEDARLLIPRGKKREVEQIYRRAEKRVKERQALKAKLEELGVNVETPDAVRP